jgi:hypothetical protein
MYNRFRTKTYFEGVSGSAIFDLLNEHKKEDIDTVLHVLCISNGEEVTKFLFYCER